MNDKANPYKTPSSNRERKRSAESQLSWTAALIGNTAVVSTILVLLAANFLPMLNNESGDSGSPVVRLLAVLNQSWFQAISSRLLIAVMAAFAVAVFGATLKQFNSNEGRGSWQRGSIIGFAAGFLIVFCILTVWLTFDVFTAFRTGSRSAAEYARGFVCMLFVLPLLASILCGCISGVLHGTYQALHRRACRRVAEDDDEGDINWGDGENS